MIRKEEVDVRELNRKVHAQAQLKPSLDAFPVKEFSVPFNSLRNRHGILNAELDTPQSFRDESLGVADQINEIRNGNPGVEPIDNSAPIENSAPLENLSTIEDSGPMENSATIKEAGPIEDAENLQLNISDPNNNIDNLELEIAPETVSAGPAVNQFLDDIKEEITTEPVVDKPQIDNKFLRAVMDIKRNTIVSKTVMVLFLILMAVLIYFGFHKKI
jgi:hypothetical protein